MVQRLTCHSWFGSTYHFRACQEAAAILLRLRFKRLTFFLTWEQLPCSCLLASRQAFVASEGCAFDSSLLLRKRVRCLCSFGKLTNLCCFWGLSVWLDMFDSTPLTFILFVNTYILLLLNVKRSNLTIPYSIALTVFVFVWEQAAFCCFWKISVWLVILDSEATTLFLFVDKQTTFCCFWRLNAWLAILESIALTFFLLVANKCVLLLKTNCVIWSVCFEGNCLVCVCGKHIFFTASDS